MRSTDQVVHKSNVLSITDGLFRESVRAVAKEYPQVEVNEQDNVTVQVRADEGRQLFRFPEQPAPSFLECVST
jgi:isocitrate dehydrogenase